MSRRPSRSAWVQFFSHSRVQVWSLGSVNGAEDWVRRLPKVESGEALFWHPAGNLSESALDVAPFAKVCLAGEPNYQDAVRWIQAGGRDYWPLPLMTLSELRDRWQALSTSESPSRRLEGGALEPLDPLTGLPGIAQLEREIAGFPERGEGVCFFIDVDHFKRVNDKVGHLAGSAALRRISALLKNALRAGDRLYRYGGDEFVVLLETAPRTDAIQVAERLREAVEMDPGDESAGSQTVSIGVAFGSGRDVLQRADEALYAAKRSSKNQVSVAPADDSGLTRTPLKAQSSFSEVIPLRWEQPL